MSNKNYSTCNFTLPKSNSPLFNPSKYILIDVSQAGTGDFQLRQEYRNTPENFLVIVGSSKPHLFY